MHTPGFVSAGKCPEWSRLLWTWQWLMPGILPLFAPKETRDNGMPLQAYLFHALSGRFVKIQAHSKTSKLHFRFEKSMHETSSKTSISTKVSLVFSGTFTDLPAFAKKHQLRFFS